MVSPAGRASPEARRPLGQPDARIVPPCRQRGLRTVTGSLPLFPELAPVPIAPAPVGLRHAEAVVSPSAQGDLVDRARTLDFAPFDFRGFKGNRRTVSFGSRYDFAHGRIGAAAPLPDWLKPLRASAGT